MKKALFLACAMMSLPVAGSSVAAEPSTVELRVLQTRTFATTDFDAVITALNDAGHALNFKGEAISFKQLNKQMTSYGCNPIMIDSLTFLYCMIRRLDNGKSVSVRLHITHAFKDSANLDADRVLYQKIFDKMGEAMFINAQKIEPDELQ